MSGNQHLSRATATKIKIRRKSTPDLLAHQLKKHVVDLVFVNRLLQISPVTKPCRVKFNLPRYSSIEISVIRSTLVIRKIMLAVGPSSSSLQHCLLVLRLRAIYHRLDGAFDVRRVARMMIPDRWLPRMTRGFWRCSENSRESTQPSSSRNPNHIFDDDRASR